VMMMMMMMMIVTDPAVTSGERVLVGTPGGEAERVGREAEAQLRARVAVFHLGRGWRGRG
jgi:hypothetical protein